MILCYFLLIPLGAVEARIRTWAPVDIRENARIGDDYPIITFADGHEHKASRRPSKPLVLPKPIKDPLRKEATLISLQRLNNGVIVLTSDLETDLDPNSACEMATEDAFDYNDRASTSFAFSESSC